MPFGLTAADMITLVLFIVIHAITAVIFMAKFNARFAVYFERVDDHGKVLFAGDGELNVVTLRAANRMKQHCSDKHTAEEGHIKNGMEKMEKTLKADIVRIDARSIETKECVAVLQHQIEGGC